MYSIAFNPHSNSFQLRDRKHLKIVGFDRLLGDFWPGFGVPTFHMVARQQGRLPVLHSRFATNGVQIICRGANRQARHRSSSMREWVRKSTRGWLL
jgi:hypothetical protein